MVRYGIYSVDEYPDQPDGKWGGFRCSVVAEGGLKKGKLYPRTDGRHHYQEKPKETSSDDLEI